MKQNYTKLFTATVCSVVVGLFIAASAHAQIITTIAGGAQGFYGDGGQATSAALDAPDGIVLDDSGNVYISDQFNQRIRKVTAKTGIINTIAGHTLAGFAGDGELDTAAKFYNPLGLTLDDSDNLYIADVTNNRIRKITAKTSIITTFAGDDSVGYYKYDDGRPADSASLYAPSGEVTDDSGNVYIADLGNSLIRKVNAKTHKISTIAGVAYSAGYSGDNGPATAAKLFSPADVALDDSGNIYISDNVNNRIRKITKATGIITTIGGNGKEGFSGDNGLADSAEMDYPFGLALDGSGNVYFADEGNNRIREINKSTGIITTIVGAGTKGLGDGGPPDSAELGEPISVAFDASGNLYIADQDHNRIREVIMKTSGINTIQASTGITVYPVPNNGRMTVKLTGNGYISMKIYDELGRVVYVQPLNTEQQVNNIDININYVPNGIYILQLLTEMGIISRKVEVQK